MQPITQCNLIRSYKSDNDEKKDESVKSQSELLHLPADRLMKQLSVLKVDKDSLLPDLEKEQVNEINAFLNKKRFTLNVSIQSILDEILEIIGPGAVPQIIGGYVRSIIRSSQKYCEKALKIALEDTLFENELESPSDWDIKITLRKGKHDLKKCFNSIIKLFKGKGVYRLKKSDLINDFDNQFAVINYEDLEIILVMEQARKKVFEHEGLSLPFPLDKVIGSYQSLTHLLTRSLNIQNIETVNIHGWPRLLTCKIKGYRSTDKCFEMNLFKKLLDPNDCESQRQGKISQLLHKQNANHHQNNIISATALFFQASYTLKNAYIQTTSLWKNFGAWSRIPMIKSCNKAKLDPDHPLKMIQNLMINDPRCFDTLSALLETVGFCSVGKGVFHLTFDGDCTAISMEMPTNHTLLLPSDPLKALTRLHKGKYKQEEQFLYFFRRLIENGKNLCIPRELPFKQKLINCSKKFLKDPRKLIREVGFELLLTIAENSLQKSLFPQIVYELSKRDHSYSRVKELLNTDFIPDSSHTPLEWVENIYQSGDKKLMKVACQMWSELSSEEKFLSAPSFCRSIIGLDNELALIVFRYLIKDKHFDSKIISSLFPLIVKSFSESELTAVIPIISKVTNKIPTEHQNEEYIKSLLSVQKQFSSFFVKPIASFEMEWEYYNKLTVSSEENLFTYYRLINNSHFLEVCKDPNLAYLKFLKMANELGIYTHRAIVTKVLTFFMQNNGCATKIYQTLRELWNPQFTLPNKARKVLTQKAPLLIKALKAQNKPEILCKLSLLLDFYEIKTAWITDDLIWAVTKILPHPDGKAILSQICKHVTSQREAVLEIAFKVKDAKKAFKLLEQIPINEEYIAKRVGRLAELDFDLAAKYLFNIKISLNSLQSCIKEMIAFSENGNCILVGRIHLSYSPEIPHNINELLDKLIHVGSADSLSLTMNLLAHYAISDTLIWVQLLKKLLPMTKKDDSLFTSSALLLAQVIDKKPSTHQKEILDLGIYTLDQLDQSNDSSALNLMYQLSALMIKNLPNCPNSVHVAEVKSTLSYSASHAPTAGIQDALNLYLERHFKLSGKCEDEVIDCLLALTKSREGIILFGNYLPRVIAKLGGRGSPLFFQAILKEYSCNIQLNEHNKIHPKFENFKSFYTSFMSKIIEKALHIHSENLTDRDVFIYDFIGRNLRSLIMHTGKPSPKISKLIQLLMYYIKPGSHLFFDDHIIHVRSVLNEAIRSNILDETSELIAECVIYLEKKVTLCKPFQPQEQKFILERVLDNLLMDHTVEEVIYAGKIFQGTHRFICRDSRNPNNYDYKFLFKTYKKIIDASFNYPHIAVNGLPVFDQIFAIFFTDNVFFALDHTKEGMCCAQKTADYLINSNIDIFKKMDWPEDAHFKRSTMHEFLMKILKMLETSGNFKGREEKYLAYVNEMLNLFFDKIKTYNEVIITELIKVSVDLITLRTPIDKTSFKNLSSANKKIQMKILLKFFSKISKIASDEQLKLIYCELTHIVNSQSFFKGYPSAFKKIKKLYTAHN